MFKFSATSKKRLDTVHPDLQILMNVVLRKGMFDLTVIEGIRTTSRQRALLARGLTKTMDSRHITGDAIDVGIYKNGKLDFSDTKAYYVLAGFIYSVALELNIPIRWGGNWDSDQNMNDQNFNDLVHWEILD